jgi:hypothetical protein
MYTDRVADKDTEPNADTIHIDNIDRQSSHPYTPLCTGTYNIPYFAWFSLMATEKSIQLYLVKVYLI